MSTPCTPSTEAMRLLGGEYPEPLTDQSDIEDNVGRGKRLSLTEFLKSSCGRTGDNTDTELMSGCSGAEDTEDERRPKTPEIALIPFQTSIITSRDDQTSSKSYRASDDIEKLNRDEDLYNQPSEEEEMECEADDLEDEPVIIPEVPIYIEDASGIVSISEQSTSRYRLPAPKATSDNEDEESSSSSEESEANMNEELTLKQAMETVTASQIRRMSIKPEQIDVVEVSENEGTIEDVARRDIFSPAPPPATGEDVTDTEDMIAESDIEEELKNVEEHTLPEVKREITRIKEICPGEAEQVHIEKIDENRYMTDAEYKKVNVPTDTEDFEDEDDLEEDEIEEAGAAPEVMLPECSLVEFLETEKRSSFRTAEKHSETENEDADNPKKQVPSKPAKERMASRETDTEDLNSEKV